MLGDPEELSDEEALAILDQPAPAKKPAKAPRELTDDEALAYLEGTSPPPRSSHGQALGSSIIEGLAAAPRYAHIVGGKMAEPFGLPPPAFLGEAAGALEGAAQAVDPLENRGQGGFVEDLERGVGQIVGAGPAMVAGPVPRAIQFAAQSAVPLYFDVLKSTGDDEAATWALLFGSGVGQLEQFGAEQALGSIVKKLSGKGVRKAVETLALRAALGGVKNAAVEGATGSAQTALEGTIFNALTPEERDIWSDVMRGLPVELTLGGASGAVDAAITGRAPQEDAAGGAPQTTVPLAAAAPDAAQGDPTEGAEMLGQSAVERGGRVFGTEGTPGPLEAKGRQQRLNAVAGEVIGDKQVPGPAVVGVGTGRSERVTVDPGEAQERERKTQFEAAQEVARAQAEREEFGPVPRAPAAAFKVGEFYDEELGPLAKELGVPKDYERAAKDRLWKAERPRVEAQKIAEAWRREARVEPPKKKTALQEIERSGGEGDFLGLPEHSLRLVKDGERRENAEPPRARTEDVVTSMRELVDEWRGKTPEADEDIPLKIQNAKRTLDLRAEAGIAPTELDDALTELVRVSNLVPHIEVRGPRDFTPEGVAARKAREADEAAKNASVHAAIARAEELLASHKTETPAVERRTDQAPPVAAQAAPYTSPGSPPGEPSLSVEEETAGPDVAPPKPVPEAEPDDATVQMFAGLPPLFGKAKQFSAKAAKGKLKKVLSSLYQGLIKTHGGKPEAAALMEERARGEVEVQASRARSATRVLQRAVKAHNKKNPTTKVTNQTLFEALTSPEAMAKLPEGVRAPAQKMRDLSDSLSRIIVDEGMTSETMSEVVEGRMGSYLRRAYKAHQDPAWAEKVPEDVRNRLESLLVSWSQPAAPGVGQALAERVKRGDREADFELRHRGALQGKSVADIRAEMSAMLQDAKRIAENPWAAFAKSKLKRQDVSLFKARKGMPEEMRSFLGEEKDPYAAYTNTIIKQASFIATHRKFKEMREQGLGKWLFEKPTTKDGVDYTTRVSAEDNPRLEPLVGDKELYSTEGVKKALFDAEKQMVNRAWRWAMVANALLKATKTVYQPFGVAKQAASQITALVRNGHMGFALRNANKIRRVLYGKKPADVVLREELVRLQVLDTSIAAAEFKDVHETMAGRRLNEPYRSVVKGNDLVGALYQQPDNFSKAAGYFAEKRALEKAGFNPEAAAREAANIVKNLYPTYSRIVSWVQKYRRQPIFGTFMAFKAEQVRTKVEALKLIGRELKSENPVLVARAKQRIAWQLAGHALAPTAALTWNMLNGIDREEDERKRKSMKADWDRQRNLVWIGKNEYTDLSDVDDGAWLTDPLLRIASGADADDVIAELWRENAEPFYSLSLASEFTKEWFDGRDRYGHEIKDRGKWLKEKLLPSFFRGKGDIRDLTGLRVSKIR